MSRAATPRWAEAIRNRRLALKKTQMEIEGETGELISQKMLSRIETGQKDPATLEVRQLKALLQALEWTPEEFAEATGLDLPFGSKEADQPKLRRPTPEETERIRKLEEVLRLAQAELEALKKAVGV